MNYKKIYLDRTLNEINYKKMSLDRTHLTTSLTHLSIFQRCGIATIYTIYFVGTAFLIYMITFAQLLKPEKNKIIQIPKEKLLQLSAYQALQKLLMKTFKKSERM